MTLQEISSVFMKGAEGDIERSVYANKNDIIDCEMSVTPMVKVSFQNGICIK